MACVCNRFAILRVIPSKAPPQTNKIFFVSTDQFQDGRLNPESWVAYGLFGASIIFISIMASSLGTHKEIPFLTKASESQKFKLENTFKDMFESLSNRII